MTNPDIDLAVLIFDFGDNKPVDAEVKPVPEEASE
jgi:hypothetical protein